MSDYVCRLLNRDELPLFAKIQHACYADKRDYPHVDTEATHASNIFNAMADHPEVYWSSVFDNVRNVHFGLFNISNGYETIAGMTALELPESCHKNDTARFATSHILTPYRGQRLSHILYDTRIQYVLDNSSCSMLDTIIHDENKPSIAVAKRYRFQRTQACISADYQDASIYTADISDLRKRKPNEDIGSHIHTLEIL